MFILAELLSSLALLISLLVNVIYFLLIVRIIMSWVSADQYNDIVQLVYKLTDPILIPFRRLPLVFGNIDFSPVLAFIALSVAKSFIVNILYKISYRLG